MDWNRELIQQPSWKEEKEQIARKMAERVQNGDVIGFGSGSTSYLTAIEIAKKIQQEYLNIVAIPTSQEIKMLCAYLNIPTASIMEKKPDWCFDGADDTKIVNTLGTKFPVPVETYPEAINFVKEELFKLGANKQTVRQALRKDGPVITENGNIIIDVYFNNITADLERKIKGITGVVESGLFIGYNVEIIS